MNGILTNEKTSMDRAARMLCLFLFLISLAITVTINFRWLYHFDIQQLNILDYTDISKEELIKIMGCCWIS